MTHHTFEEVTHRVTKHVPCRVCGKKVTRSTTLSQTINPFNTGADGTPKTRHQIHAELDAEAKAWYPWNDIHQKCIATEVAQNRDQAAS